MDRPLLKPYAVLFIAPNASQISVQPVAATDMETALSMVGAALVQQNMSEAMVMGAFDEDDLSHIQNGMSALREAIGKQ